MTVQLFQATGPQHFRAPSASELRPGGVGVTWIDLNGATQREIEDVAAAFDFHPLALEDALNRRQRPKVDVYPNHLFIVLYAMASNGREERPALRELSMFVTRNAVVTVHRDRIDDLEFAAHRWSEHCVQGLSEDAGMLVYTIADTVVDGYFPAIDAIGDEIDRLEFEIFEGGGEETLQRVFRMKRVLLEMRRLVAPTREVFNAFTRRELPLLGDTSLTYYQDVYDHVIRVTDSIDAYRDILSSVIDVHLTLVSNKMNQTVRTLTSASIILMSLALVAGIYGMNFEHMPELTWRYGYYAVIATMAALAAGLAYMFRIVKWW